MASRPICQHSDASVQVPGSPGKMAIKMECVHVCTAAGQNNKTWLTLFNTGRHYLRQSLKPIVRKLRAVGNLQSPIAKHQSQT